MKISVIITFKKNVLDPQGQVIQKTLNGMGFNSVDAVRQGKFFDIVINETDKKKAYVKTDEICKKLLANLIIEDYKIIDNFNNS